MTAKNFDFDGINDDNRYEERDNLGVTENHVTVETFLHLKFGKARGRTIYQTLKKTAMKAAEENGGLPGIIFDDDGGQFVSFHQNDD